MKTTKKKSRAKSTASNEQKVKSAHKILDWIKANKLKFGVIVGSVLLVLAILIATVAVVLNMASAANSDVDTSGDSTTEENQIDFDQEITGEGDEAFNPNYEIGSDANLVAHFANLECDENCENVSDLKIGDLTLERGKNYEVTRGSVIITIFADTLKDLALGEYEVTFEIVEDGKKAMIGFRLVIEDNIPTCAENQVLENNQCIEKKEEQSTQTNNTTPAQTPAPAQPTQPNQQSVATDASGVPLVDYSTGVAAYMIPNNNAYKGSRAYYTANGGWEYGVFSLYSNYLMDLKYGRNASYGGSISYLCFSSFVYDFATMTISQASWDDSETPTCDRVRSEHPAIPSAEYLTSLLRKIHASGCYLNDVNWAYCRNPQW